MKKFSQLATLLLAAALYVSFAGSSAFAQGSGAMIGQTQTYSGNNSYTGNLNFSGLNIHSGNETFQNIVINGSCTGAGCSGGSSFTPSTNGTTNSTTSGLNFLNSSTNADGLIATFSNPSGLNERVEITGVYNGTAPFLLGCASGLSAGAVCYWNGTSWAVFAGNNSGTEYFTESSAGVPSWTAASAGSFTPQTNSTNNATLTGLNLETSTANAVGLTVTPVNTSGVIEKFEVSGGSYSGNSATASALAAAPSICASGFVPRGVGANGTALDCFAPSGSITGVVQGGAVAATSTSSVGPVGSTFYAQDMCTGGACPAGIGDVCDKINAALLACPTGSVDQCNVIVTPTTAGSVDVCSSTTSDFFNGVGSILVDMYLLDLVQLKAAPTWPENGHIVHGITGNQNVRGTGFIMDPTFPTNLTLSTGEGPFPAGNYRALIIDGGRSSTTQTNQWQNNAFGGKWRDLSLDCNEQTNCIAFYTANMQEDSGLFNLRIFGLAANSATSVSACGFWDHFAASSNNTGPSHIQVIDSYCDPYIGSTGTTSNNTIYGWVYEAYNSSTGSSGGNIRISGGTLRGASSTQLMVDTVWIDASTTDIVENIHAEWQNNEAVYLGAGGNATTNSLVEGISDVNHSVTAVHFGSTSTGNTAIEVTNGVTDDNNSCDPTTAAVQYYAQDDGGQGFWNGGWHVCGSGNTDATGALTFSSSTSQTYSFGGTYSVAPQCLISPTSNTTISLWPTATTSTLTIHAASSFSGTVTYQCKGRGI